MAAHPTTLFGLVLEEFIPQFADAWFAAVGVPHRLQRNNPHGYFYKGVVDEECRMFGANELTALKVNFFRIIYSSCWVIVRHYTQHLCNRQRLAERMVLKRHQKELVMTIFHRVIYGGVDEPWAPFTQQFDVFFQHRAFTPVFGHRLLRHFITEDVLALRARVDVVRGLCRGGRIPNEFSIHFVQEHLTQFRMELRRWNRFNKANRGRVYVLSPQASHRPTHVTITATGLYCMLSELWQAYADAQEPMPELLAQYRHAFVNTHEPRRPLQRSVHA